MLKMKLLAVAAMVLLGGCSRMPSIPNPLDMVSGPSEIRVEVPPPAGAMPLLRNGQTLSIAMADFADARPVRGRKIGDIKTTVSNMHGTELAIDQDVATVLTTAARNQLAADGFRLAGGSDAADFRLGATVKAFSLNIAGRDERLIVADIALREAKSGDLIWSGVVAEKDDRYAGVTGNSRGTITEYLGEGVASFAGKLSAAVRDGLAKSYPRSISVSQSKNFSSVPGVTTLHAPTSRDEPRPAPAPVPVPVAAPAPAAVAAPSVAGPASGHVSVLSVPARAKVYVADVYYGMTPLKVELPVGISQLNVRLDGYKSMTEKVAVRRGETTELEVKLSK